MRIKAKPGDQLTDAEQAVGELVARGRTNKEIAAERVTSIRTVHSHLCNLYAKTGTQNRVELTNWLRTPPAARRVPAPGTPPPEKPSSP